MGDYDSLGYKLDALGRRRFERDVIFGHREEDDGWRSQAACIGQGDLFFIDRGASARPAKKICATCPVTEDCLDYALRTSAREGIWGGLSERERRKVKQQRAREAS